MKRLATNKDICAVMEAIHRKDDKSSAVTSRVNLSCNDCEARGDKRTASGSVCHSSKFYQI